MTLAPPHNIEAERAVLSAMILDVDAALYVLDVLEVRHFYRDAHGMIFDAISALHADKIQPDELLVYDKLIQQNHDERAGGLDYLRELSRLVTSGARIEQHCNLVRKAALLRDVIVVCSMTLEDCQQAGSDPNEILAAAEKRIMEVGRLRKRDDPVSLRNLVHGAIREIENERADPEKATGILCGHTDLDASTGGWKPGQLIVLAARTSQGKTTLAFNWALQAAESGTPVLCFSLEMSQAQMGRNVLSVLARREMHTDVVRQLADYPYDEAVNEILTKADWPLWVDDTPQLTISQLRARARRMKFQHDIGLVLVDYLQLVKAPGAEKRHLEIGEVTQGLKGMAKDLDLPVIALAQVKREASKPSLSSLRESGSIEQDADVVILMHPVARGSTDRVVRIAKNRSGPTSECTLAFTPQTLTFHDPL